MMNYMNTYHMLQAGDTVAAGISGGADSVCLLFVLCTIRKHLPFRLIAVHVNHLIREEAGEDAAYVERLCREWGCPYRYVEEDVAGYARGNRMSVEEAGRFLRYRAFAQVLREADAPDGKIAVAHNQNDNAETVLFHLFRGSGLAGLSGIRPVRGNVIRPLLGTPRAEIEAFLQENRIACRIDRTNYDDTYTRNRVRHHVLACAEQEICERAVPHIYDASVMISEADAYIGRCTEQALQRCAVVREAEIVFEQAAFMREYPVIQKRLLLSAMQCLCGGRDIGAVHVRLFHELFLRQGNGSIDFPHGMTALREYGSVRLVRSGVCRAEAKAADAEKTAREQALQIPGEVRLSDGLCVACSLLPRQKTQIIPQKTYTKWFDYDKIIKSLVLRTRRTGDYLLTRTDGGKKTLKAYMIDEKIPRALRERVPVVADGEHIIWVVGYRISDYYKVDEQTKTVLQIKVTGGTTDGREDQSTVDGRRC